MQHLFAHYFAARSGAFVIISKSATTRLVDQIAKVTVSGKREARQIAAQHNARPWNF